MAEPLEFADNGFVLNLQAAKITFTPRPEEEEEFAPPESDIPPSDTAPGETPYSEIIIPDPPVEEPIPEENNPV